MTIDEAERATGAKVVQWDIKTHGLVYSFEWGGAIGGVSFGVRNEPLIVAVDRAIAFMDERAKRMKEAHGAAC